MPKNYDTPQEQYDALRDALRALCCIVMDEYPSTDGRYQRADRYMKEFDLGENDD